MRAIFWLVLVILVVVALKKKSKVFSGSAHFEASPESKAPQSSSPENAIESMLCCERCQVYFPASEAVLRGRQIYCCAAHADQA